MFDQFTGELHSVASSFWLFSNNHYELHVIM